MNWPLVDKNDDGIRPASGSGMCHYCKSKVGEEHARNCTSVTKWTRIRHSFELEVKVPRHWDSDMINSHYRKSSSPMDMLYYMKKLFEGRIEDNGDLDHLAKAYKCQYVGVADDTPKRLLEDEQRLPGVDMSKYRFKMGEVTWPDEDKLGDGISPADESDTGFKQVRIRPSFELEEDKPHHWSPEMITSYFNESASISNILFAIRVWADYREGYYDGDAYKCEYLGDIK